MTRAVLLELLGLYRAIGSALLPPSCRFHPSCSEFAEGALRSHAPLRAVGLILGRLARCHPFQPGGLDPVPAAPTR